MIGVANIASLLMNQKVSFSLLSFLFFSRGLQNVTLLDQCIFKISIALFFSTYTDKKNSMIVNMYVIII